MISWIFPARQTMNDKGHYHSYNMGAATPPDLLSYHFSCRGVCMNQGKCFSGASQFRASLVVPVKQTVTYRASFGHVELFQEYRKPLRSK